MPAALHLNADSRIQRTAEAVAAFVEETRTLDHGTTDPALPLKNTVITHLARPSVLNLSEQTARNRLHEARDAGLVHELRPGDGSPHRWSLTLPGAHEAGLVTLLYMTAVLGTDPLPATSAGRSRRVHTWTVSDIFHMHTPHGPGGKALISTPARTGELVTHFEAQADRRAAGVQAARDAAERAERAENDRRDPRLAALMQVIRERFTPDGDATAAVRLHRRPVRDGRQPWSDAAQLVTLEARTPEDVTVLRRLLEDALTSEERARYLKAAARTKAADDEKEG